ncbi:hypothetical protein F220043C3_17550 [Enterocloster asparagiformis]|uniref:hypothetical protein n=1 Tax=Enterocloster asparagiformis TaxID=333367 RepID=UPI0034C430B7
MKAKLVTILLMMSMMMATTAYAAGPSEGAQTTQSQQQATQSDRWEGAGDTWKVRTQDGTSYLTNSWFQDNDASWYMLGADGTMYAGLVTDLSTGKSYLLNTQHDGTFGKMLTVDGVYTVNGSQVYLTFNQSHDGSYGAIQSGLSEARSTGVKETSLTSIPSDSASSTTSSATQQPQNTNDQQTPAKSTGGSILDDIRESEQKVGTPTYNGSGENWLQG